MEDMVGLESNSMAIIQYNALTENNKTLLV